MPKRTRPENEDYYIHGPHEHATEHFRQGDIFQDIPFPMALPEPPPADEPIGVGARRVLETPFFAHTFGILISHSSGFMAQPPGTRGYSHVFRVMAPIFPVSILLEQDMVRDETMHLLRKEDRLVGYMFLPPCAGAWDDDRAVTLYRPGLVHYELLEDRRVVQLHEDALKHLQAKIVESFTGKFPNADDLSPSMGDHWNRP